MCPFEHLQLPKLKSDSPKPLEIRIELYQTATEYKPPLMTFKDNSILYPVSHLLLKLRC